MSTPVYPEDVDTGTVFAKLAQFADGGAPVAGVQITFTPSVTFVADQGADPKLMPVGDPFTMTTDAAGVASIVLPSNLDPDLSGQGWNYQVDFEFPGSNVDASNKKMNAPWHIDVPMNVTTNLAMAANLSGSAKTMIVRGPAGVGVPDGGTDGQVLARSGTDGTIWVDPPAGTWSGLTGKPAVIGAGATQQAARDAIGAISAADVPAQQAADWNTLNNKPAVIGAGATQAAARTAIGAVTTGTTAGTALDALGTAAKAAKWATARTITLTGDVTGTITIDGSGDVSVDLSTPNAAVIVPWTGTGWPAYTQDPNKIRFFLSLNDPNATAPTYYNAQDMWFGVEA